MVWMRAPDDYYTDYGTCPECNTEIEYDSRHRLRSGKIVCPNCGWEWEPDIEYYPEDDPFFAD